MDKRRKVLSLLESSRLNEAQVSGLARISSDIDQTVDRLNGKVQDLTAISKGRLSDILERLGPILKSVQGGQLESVVKNLEKNAELIATRSAQLAEEARWYSVLVLRLSNLQKCLIKLSKG